MSIWEEKSISNKLKWQKIVLFGSWSLNNKLKLADILKVLLSKLLKKQILLMDSKMEFRSGSSKPKPSLINDFICADWYVLMETQTQNSFFWVLVYSFLLTKVQVKIKSDSIMILTILVYFIINQNIKNRKSHSKFLKN